MRHYLESRKLRCEVHDRGNESFKYEILLIDQPPVDMGRPNVGEGRGHWPAAGVLHDFTNELLQNSNFVTRAYFLRQVFVSLTPLLFFSLTIGMTRPLGRGME